MQLTDLLGPALRDGYAVPAFNVVDGAMMAGVVAAAHRVHSPVILQVSERIARALGPKHFKTSFDQLVAETDTTAILHLDHCGDPALVEACLSAGWDSALYDASHLPFGEAVRTTTEVVRTAERYGAQIEGEFERIGRVTVADEPAVRPVSDSVTFIRKTGVACFSPAVGTLHGRYVTAPRLQPERVEEIVRACGIPQVLHGATGLDDAVLQEFVDRGVSKINFSTVLKGAHTDAVRSHAAERGYELEPLNLFLDIRTRVTKVAEHYMVVLQSHGRAS
ncbi:class II fructose-bisphosphate aldolase [Streptomyces sp. DSM 42041]|uniref:Class II fructose-bisphosphate aldolase n=1 Tax=Streptomyces hazeniae TaxID=3075538 RepID=A0ABU2NYU9_9ACTN|nr:class II fructose-bisphosphate aldolase [Streptomyces sp. DSM 42041]MDT0382160.1 class II fructose-bisphosphate aldolase [Streptomyces sp. DSM 42041]